jgi:O-antigen/teichoic acid export membrane protein
MSDIKRIAKMYKSFPIFSLPADFLAIFSRELPVLMLSGFFGAGVVGQYALTKRTLDAPFSLLSTSILEVFKQQATEDYHREGNCRRIFLSTLKKLFTISLIPFLFLFIVAPSLFSFVFGEEWRIAGEYARILSVMYFFKFISSPLTYVFFIFNKLQLNLILQGISLALHGGLVYSAYLYYQTTNAVIIALSISFSIIYSLYLLISYEISKGL